MSKEVTFNEIREVASTRTKLLGATGVVSGILATISLRDAFFTVADNMYSEPLAAPLTALTSGDMARASAAFCFSVAAAVATYYASHYTVGSIVADVMEQRTKAALEAKAAKLG